jgi:uncharacterized protein with PIN domain
MLGSLATWLRFLGIDTFYSTDHLNDDEIINIAIDENRILITKDKDLIVRARKKNISVISMKTVDFDEQLKEVITNINFDIKRILTRCSICNTTLKSIEKNSIKDEIPLKVYQNQTRFWVCPYCNKIYWRGSHYDDIIKKIKNFNKYFIKI